MDDPKSIARAAFRRAEQLERDLLARWPDLWQEMDRMRTHPPQPWPDWCLLPMAAAAGVTGGWTPTGPAPVALASALYAWRFAKSVYVIEPALADRLLTQVPDAIELEDVTGLPEWCLHIAAGDGVGLWIHLESDANHGRPELRLLLDIPDQPGPVPVPVYLDRDNLTEALGDFQATALATLAGPRELVPGRDVHGGGLDALVAELADRVEAYVGIAAYLSRPEADIAEQGRPGVRPLRRRKVARDRTVWLVGFADS